MSIINNTVILFDNSFYSFNVIPRFIYQLIPLNDLNRAVDVSLKLRTDPIK